MAATPNPWIAALPMYDFPELAPATDALWAALAARLAAAGVREPPDRLTRTLELHALWRHPRLLLGQGCAYPLAKLFGDSTQPVATPCYAAPGCEGATYRSAIVVRRADSAATLADLRHRRCVINDPESNSGMNLLRAAVAPLAGGRRFFRSVAVSGGHRRSAEMVAAGEADVAALDCVTYALLERLDPATAGLRVIGWTPASIALPFITARSTDATVLTALRDAWTQVVHDPALASLREELLLRDVNVAPDPDFGAVLELERDAAAQGYPLLI